MSLSQYPNECEVVFPPCTALEAITEPEPLPTPLALEASAVQAEAEDAGEDAGEDVGEGQGQALIRSVHRGAWGWVGVHPDRCAYTYTYIHMHGWVGVHPDRCAASAPRKPHMAMRP